MKKLILTTAALVALVAPAQAGRYDDFSDSDKAALVAAATWTAAAYRPTSGRPPC
jgi:hypothetical protein